MRCSRVEHRIFMSYPAAITYFLCTFATETATTKTNDT